MKDSLKIAIENQVSQVGNLYMVELGSAFMFELHTFDLKAFDIQVTFILFQVGFQAFLDPPFEWFGSQYLHIFTMREDFFFQLEIVLHHQ